MPQKQPDEKMRPIETYSQYHDVIDALDDEQKIEMESHLFNAALNSFCERHAGHQLPGIKPEPPDIMYMGWGWRSVRFFERTITLADSGTGDYGTSESIIGFCENNKWDYWQRLASPAEAEMIVKYLIDAWKVEQRDPEQCQRTLINLRNFMQTEIVIENPWPNRDNIF